MKSDSRAATHHKSPWNMPGNQLKAAERLPLKGHKRGPQRVFWSYSDSKLQRGGGLETGDQEFTALWSLPGLWWDWFQMQNRIPLYTQRQTGSRAETRFHLVIFNFRIEMRMGSKTLFFQDRDCQFFFFFFFFCRLNECGLIHYFSGLQC